MVHIGGETGTNVIGEVMHLQCPSTFVLRRDRGRLLIEQYHRAFVFVFLRMESQTQLTALPDDIRVAGVTHCTFFAISPCMCLVHR